MKLLDLFCGAGGAAMGYHRAGFTEIVGVDIKPMPRYPFRFIQGDALEYVAAHGREFDAIHASPPCQAYSIMRNLPWLRKKEYPRLIDPTRELLVEMNTQWVIENVMGAKLSAGWLCGSMFGLPIYRHRYFETPFLWLQPEHKQHEEVIEGGRMLGSRARVPVRKSGHRYGSSNAIGHGNSGGISARDALTVPWMSRDEATQAIPPAYTEFIGKQLLDYLRRAA